MRSHRTESSLNEELAVKTQSPTNLVVQIGLKETPNSIKAPNGTKIPNGYQRLASDETTNGENRGRLVCSLVCQGPDRLICSFQILTSIFIPTSLSIYKWLTPGRGTPEKSSRQKKKKKSLQFWDILAFPSLGSACHLSSCDLAKCRVAP